MKDKHNVKQLFSVTHLGIKRLLRAGARWAEWGYGELKGTGFLLGGWKCSKAVVVHRSEYAKHHELYT